MSEIDHQARAHAVLGASGAKKWTSCTMSAAVEKLFPDEDSEYSLEGTCAHGVGEARLQDWLYGPMSENAEQYDREAKEPNYDRFFNQAFSDHVQQYVDFVISKITELRAKYGHENVIVLLEQRLDFSKWVPHGFGTGDVVIIVPGRVIVIDLKFGQGVFVDGEDNDQIKLYALGAFDRYNMLFDFEEVEVLIHQPRKNNVSGETISVHSLVGLLVWAEQLIRPRAAIAWAAYNGDTSEARFSPGQHCSDGFCKARGSCAARARYMLELAELPYSLSEPDLLTIPQAEKVLDKTDLAIKWASDVKAWLTKQAEDGVKLERYTLTEGRSNRRITNDIEAAQILMSNGYAATDIYKHPELKGLGELETLAGKANLTGLLGELLVKPPGKSTLKLLSDKVAAKAPKRSKADDDFE